MTTSQKTPFLIEILGDEPIPLGKLAYFRERFRDRLYELVVEEFLKSGMTRAELARRISRKPEQVTRWLGAPGNWEIDTVSDILLAICKAQPRIELDRLDHQRRSNRSKPDWQIDAEDAARQGSTAPSPSETTNTHFLEIQF
jgi:hypothetical protein